MTRIDRMLYAARVLDVRTREYKPCLIVEKTAKDTWMVRGSNRQFTSEAQAVEFCKEQAGGRPVGIVIDDIPRVLPDGDYIDTCKTNEADAVKELMEYGRKGAP
ncbi:MAG: hypothetical protein IKN81_10420 [Oscillospiraceae bacterium]|nr:hypothetical protein [Oscillospiraceae bacterium]